MCIRDSPWPAVPGLPRYGYVVTRKDLDAMVADHAAKAGAALWGHTEAAEAIMDCLLYTSLRPMCTDPCRDAGIGPNRAPFASGSTVDVPQYRVDAGYAGDHVGDKATPDHRGQRLQVGERRGPYVYAVRP